MATLSEWLAFAPQLDSVYQAELGRSIFSDEQAFVNWSFHWREGGHDLAWIRDRIRESPEWAAHNAPPPQADPAPSASTPLPTRGRRVIRITDERDGGIMNRGYPYWSQSYIDGDVAIVFVGSAGGRPRFYRVHLEDGVVDRMGSLLDYIGTGEGWYFDVSGRLYITEGPRLHRVNPFTPTDDVVLFDVSASHPGCRIWQAHSSYDGNSHSATVERPTASGPFDRLGTVAVRNGAQHFFGPRYGALDESQISGNGRFLVIKEGDDNRIIDLDRDVETYIPNVEGAIGHSDNGPDYMVGENDQIGACEWVDLSDAITHRRVLFHTWNMGHVSVRAGRCLLSDPVQLALVPLDGSMTLEHVALHGMVVGPGDAYDYQVFANLDPSGRIAVYISNAGTSRFDAYLAVL